MSEMFTVMIFSVNFGGWVKIDSNGRLINGGEDIA